MIVIGDVTDVRSTIVMAAATVRLTRTRAMSFVTLTGRRRGVHAADRAVAVQADDQRVTRSGEDLCHHQGGDEKMLRHDSIHESARRCGLYRQ